MPSVNTPIITDAAMDLECALINIQIAISVAPSRNNANIDVYDGAKSTPPKLESTNGMIESISMGIADTISAAKYFPNTICCDFTGKERRNLSFPLFLSHAKENMHRKGISRTIVMEIPIVAYSI